MVKRSKEERRREKEQGTAHDTLELRADVKDRDAQVCLQDLRHFCDEVMQGERQRER